MTKTIVGTVNIVEHEWDYGVWINMRYSPFVILVDSDIAIGERTNKGMRDAANEPMYLPKNWTI